jgi:adenylosuccinate synthase
LTEAWIVVDLGFGDAGKGSVVDFLVRDRAADLVVRWNGGAQAGHTVIDPLGRTHTFSQFGAGTFVPGTRTHLGEGFLFHPMGWALEAERLRSIGIADATARWSIHRRACVITPFQQAAGRLRDLENGHGTCGIGVGETRRDNLERRDDRLCVGDFSEPKKLRRVLERQQERKRSERIRSDDPRARLEWTLLDDPSAPARIVDAWSALVPDLTIVDDTARVLHSVDRVVFEGAQGILLDETWGFHPHTTWTDCTPAVPRALLGDVPATTLGVIRSYATRHGAGPFPSHDPQWDDALDEPHNLSDGWQGSFRRGPLDLVLLRYALELAPVDGLVVNHLDRVTRGVVDSYDLDGANVDRLEPGAADRLEHRAALARSLARCRPRTHDEPVLSRLQGLAPVLATGHGPTARDKCWTKIALG